MNITVNLALVPLDLSGIHSAFGVDFLYDKELADTGRLGGDADFVRWVEFADQSPARSGESVMAVADELIRRQWYRRVSDWDVTGSALVQAKIAPSRYVERCVGSAHGWVRVCPLVGADGATAEAELERWRQSQVSAPGESVKVRVVDDSGRYLDAAHWYADAAPWGL